MNFHISKNGWLILGTALIIGVAFSIYFLVYVKDREKKLIENNFRVLRQIRENMKAQENYFKNAIGCDHLPNEKLIPEYREEGIILVYNQTDSLACDTINYHEFFDNDLLIRQDVFDYIIISRFEDDAGNEGMHREILYTNAPGNVADSVFQQENLASFFELTIAAREYVSFNQNIDGNIYISGLVNSSSFARQKRGVSLFVIIIFSVILIFIILNMPLIKMKIMSRTESLDASDVMLSGLSILLGSAVLLILLLSGLIYFVSERSRTHDYLERLSYRLEGQFSTEMTNIIHQLDQVREKFPPQAKFEDRRLVFNSEVLNIFQTKPASRDEKYEIDGYRMYRNVLNSPESTFSHYRHFNYIFWCDSAARALIFLTPFKNPVYVQDLSHRKYLTSVIEGSRIRFRNPDHEEIPIGFESIKSVNDGTYEVGIGINSGDNNLPILAMSTKLLSVMDPVLPEGYGFCILDEEGNTVFHSNIQKNMNENFINETLETFQPAINSQTQAFKSVTYGNQKYMIHFRPMTSLPGHFLATFTSEESYNTPYSLALYNSLLLFFGFLAILALIYLIFYFIVFRENKLQRSGFLFDWLRPFESIQHYSRYRKLFRLNIITILYLLISSRIIWYERDILVNNLLLTISVLLICSFHYLYVLIPREIRLTSHLTRTDGKQKYFRILFLGAGAVLILLLLFNRASLIMNYKDMGPVFLREIFMLLVNLGLIAAYIRTTGIYIPKYQSETMAGPEPEKLSRIPLLYQGYLFTWVIIISIIPIHVFFGMSYDLEKEILIKYKAYRTSGYHDVWEKNIEQEFRNNFNPTGYETFLSSMKGDGFHLLLPDYVRIRTAPEKGPVNLQGRMVLVDSIYQKIRPFYNQLAFQSDGFIHDASYDGSWRVTRDSSCITNLFPMCGKLMFHKDNLTLEYQISGFFDLFRKGWRIILIFLPAALLVYFKLIQFSSKRIYGFKFKKFADSIARRAAGGEKPLLDALCAGKQLNHVFYVSLDNLHSSPAIEARSYLEGKGCSTGHLDFYDLGRKEIVIGSRELSFRFDASGELIAIDNHEEKFKSGNKDEKKQPDKRIIILIDHFEHEFKDPEVNSTKYRILKALSNIPEVRLVVFSAINVLSFLDYYNDSRSTLENKIGRKTEEKDRKEIMNIMQAVDVETARWQALFGKFVEFVVPLKKNKIKQKIREDADYLLEEELNYGKYLNFQYPILEKFKNLDNAPDDMVCRTQQVSSTYYLAQWNMLSKDEKLLVHDIARNKFVNTKDSSGVFSLLNKGIFIYDHSLRSMNESFSNFVMSRMSHDEVMEKEVEARKKGAWNTTFIILLLVIVSLVAFLSIGQLSFLNDINSLFTSLGALLAIIVRFGGFFVPGK